MAYTARNRPASTSSSLPPRVLNVQNFAESRAAELEALHAIISNRNAGNFRLQPSKRRRTSSHDAKRKKRAKIGSNPTSMKKINEEGGEKKLSRRVRRRVMFRRNDELGFCSSGDGTERLRTHLWHAKRFTMVKRWGFYLPLGVHGRGRGSRALLKRLKSGTLIHDSSYCSAIQLTGREDSIMAILRKLFVQPSLDVSERKMELVSLGMCYQSAMLHHFGAPVSKFICPVTYMWRPVEGNANDRQSSLPSGCSLDDIRNSCRMLWIWVHAASFNEALDVLSDASREQTCKDGTVISCTSLKGKLGKLELFGSEVTQILQKVLHSALKFQQEQSSKLSMIFEGADESPSSVVLSLHVQDPRDLSLTKEDEPAPLAKYDDTIQSDFPNEDATVPSKLHKEPECTLGFRSVQDPEFLSDSKQLWESHDQLKPPINDSRLCLEKQGKKLRDFYLDDAEPGTLVSEDQDLDSRTCPVFLLKHSFQNKKLQGWSIVLPLSWVKVFWISLVTRGARVIGLRERRWVASDCGIPCFPFDFPDCKAYAKLMSEISAEMNLAAERRPLPVRPTKIPIPPPWDCVSSSVAIFQKNDQFPPFKNICNITAQSAGPPVCLGSLMRSWDMLHQSLKRINGANLLLFPDNEMCEKPFSILLERERIKWAPRRVESLFLDRSLLWCRVLLCPCREGTFEDGAVVCAPLLSDILLLSASPEERGKVQLSQSMTASYFLEVDSGTWTMQVPEDPLSHRWPIGFVTSGSTHGSAHPTAMGVCEATLLAELRQQQWREKQEKSKPEVE
ncbi:ribonucleases P/MRP protein subunit POP1-like isoform X2 [Wolffia australiana]